MTLKEAKLILKAIGFTLTKREDEYRLNPFGGGEPTAYYTNDLQDAVGTAKARRAEDLARELARMEWQAWVDYGNGDGPVPLLPTIH